MVRKAVSIRSLRIDRKTKSWSDRQRHGWHRFYRQNVIDSHVCPSIHGSRSNSIDQFTLLFSHRSMSIESTLVVDRFAFLLFYRLMSIESRTLHVQRGVKRQQSSESESSAALIAMTDAFWIKKNCIHRAMSPLIHVSLRIEELML